MTSTSALTERFGVHLPAPPPICHDWTDRAACAGQDTALWFPASYQRAEVETAKAVCRSCPSADDCRAEHPNEPDGIWWATTPTERDQGRLRAKWRAAAARRRERDRERAAPGVS